MPPITVTTLGVRSAVPCDLDIRDAAETTVEVRGDLLGRRRIYYRREESQVVLSDDLAQLLPASGRPALDHGCLAFFLQHGLTPAARTPFAGIRKVPAGHVLHIDTSTLSVVTSPHPALRELTADPAASLRDAVDGVRQAITECPADVVTLSGGLDSTYLLALLAATGREVRALAVESAGGRDEGHWRRLAADHLGVELFEHRAPERHYARLLDAAVRVLPDPVGHHVIASYAATHAFLRSLRLRGCASGDGAEEVFDRETHQVRRDRLGRLQPSRICFDREDAASLLVPGAADTPLETLEAEQHASVLGLTSTADPVLLNNLFFHLSGFQLHPQDQIARARGTEANFPFLAWDCLRPGLVRADLVGPDTGKQVLRAAARGLIPEEIINRPKMGLSSAFDTSVRTVGADLFRQRIAACDLFSQHGLDHVERLLQEHRSMTGKGHARPLSCAYLMASWWLHWVAPDGLAATETAEFRCRA